MTNNPLVLGIKSATLSKIHQEILELSKDSISLTILQEIKEQEIDNENPNHK